MRKEKEMNNVECVTRDELHSLETRVSTDINSLRTKIDDICKGNTKTMETVFDVKSTVEILKNTTNDLKVSFEKNSTENTARLSTLKDDIIKEITLIFLQEQGTKLFKNKLQLLIGGGLICFLGAIVIAAAGWLGSGIITRIAQALS